MAEAGKAGSPVQEPDAATYDVMVKLPAKKKIGDISTLSLQAAGIPEKHIDHLLELLGRGQMAKVKGSVPEGRAREIGQRFIRAGLEVGIMPAITVYTIVGDGKETCPACNHRVALPDNRQCPNCHVFVDKISRKFLAKRRKEVRAKALREAKASNAKLDLAERNRLAALEEEFHTKILRELGPKFRLVKRFRPLHGKSRWLQFAAGAIAVSAIFVAGYFTATVVAAALKPPPDEDAPRESRVVTALRERLVQLGIVEAPRDPRGDPISIAVPPAALLRGPQGERITLRRLGLEHALDGGSTGAAAPASSAAIGVTLPVATKIRFAAQFARTLAELGQTARAQDLLRALKDTPELAHEPAAAALVREVEIETQAAALLALPAARARPAINKLLPQIATLANTSDKVHSLARLAEAASRHRELEAEVALDLVSQAGTIARTIADAGARNAAFGDSVVAHGGIVAQDIERNLSRGLPNAAQAALPTFERLLKAAPDPWSRARLTALDARIQDQLGDRERARAQVDAALALVAKFEDVAEQIASLRALLRYLPASARPRIQALAAAMPARVDALDGRGKAQTGLQLSLLQADLGNLPAAQQLAQAARAVAGLSVEEKTAVAAEALMQREFATARALHAAGQYPETEAVLRRVAGYLL